MQGTTMLVTGSSGGWLAVWNTDSGAIIRTMTHPALSATPAQDRGIEQVTGRRQCLACCGGSAGPLADCKNGLALPQTLAFCVSK